MKKMNVAIIGLGHQAIEDHLPAVKETDLVELIAVCDKDSEKTKKISKEFNVRGYTDYDNLLKKEKLDFIIVAVPHNEYGVILTKAIRKGIHVLKEKPFALNLKEAKELALFSKKERVVIMTTLQRRFNPVYHTFFQLIKEIGDPFLIDIEYNLYIKDPSIGWRGEKKSAGGGCVIDMGYHMIDMIIWYFGLPSKVHAEISSNAISDKKYAEDTAIILFSYGEKLKGTLKLSRFVSPKKELIKIVGTKGTIEIGRGYIKKTKPDGTVTEYLKREKSWPVAALNQIEYFVKVINGEEKNIGDPDYHLNHMAFIEACYLSNKKNSYVNPFELLNDGNEKGRLRFNWPILTDRTKKAVINQLGDSISIYDNSGIIGKLENRFSKYLGLKHSLLTNSGTSALHSMYVGAGLKEGDEIICPAYTFFATITPIFNTGAVPILVDCLENGNIDPDKIEDSITSKTKAVVITHMWGRPCDMKKIVKICNENNLLLLEDISHALGAKIDGKPVGSFGDASACSLQSQKNLVAGEGGVLSTNNSEIFYKALLFGHYNKRCKNEIPRSHKLSQYSTTGMGLKLRIHPLAAAIANEQFDKLDRIIEQRNQNAKKMIIEINKIEGLSIIEDPENYLPAYYSLIINYDKSKMGNVAIEDFQRMLIEQGCEEFDIPGSTCPLNYHSLFQKPEGLYPSYKGKMDYKKGDFPVSEKLYLNILKLPVWHNKKDIKIINEYIRRLKLVAKKCKEGKMEITKQTVKELYDKALKEGIEKPVVGAVIQKDDKVLLLERPSDDFMGGINELPSGNMELGEDILDSLIREVKEETNLEIEKVLKYLGHFDYKSGSGKNARQFNFLVSVKDGDIKLSEHDGFFWAAKDDKAFSKVTDSVKGILENC